MKKVLKGLGILVGLVVLVGAVAAVMIDPFVRKKVERESSAALKVPTRLNAASVRLTGGVTLSKFEIHNPPSFSEPRAVTFERFDLAVRPRELLQSKVDIDQVTVFRPELTLEFTGAKNNLSKLLDNLSAGRAQTSDGKKFLVRKLRIEEAVVRFRSDLLSGGTRSVLLPAIELENVGNAEGGATMAEILRTILQTLGSAALKAGEGMVPSELLDSVRADLESQLRGLPGKALEELKKKLPEDLERKLKNPLERKPTVD